MGVLHHAIHPVYLEMGRTELLRQSGYTYKALEERGIYLVITRLELRYRSPARYDDELTIRTSLKRITHTRIEHEYEMSVDGRLVCEAGTTLACVDRDARVQPLPDEILALAESPARENG
jgi:acyl-CoA thioester hydrolase